MQAPSALPPAADPPALVVHDTGDLRRAIEAARCASVRTLRLLSAPDAACFMGPAWWRSLMDIASILADGAGLALTDILDCGDSAGRALEALRLGQRVLVLEPTTQWEAVRARAEVLGSMLLPRRPPALDLAQSGVERLLAAWLHEGSTAADDSRARSG